MVTTWYSFQPIQLTVRSNPSSTLLPNIPETSVAAQGGHRRVHSRHASTSTWRTTSKTGSSELVPDNSGEETGNGTSEQKKNEDIATNQAS